METLKEKIKRLKDEEALSEQRAEEYKRAIKSEKGLVKAHAQLKAQYKKVEDVKSELLPFGVDEYLKAMASLWDVSQDRLNVFVGFDSIEGRKNYNEMVRQHYTPRGEEPHYMTLHVSCRIGEKVKRARIEMPLSMDSFDEVQRDGKTLGQHLKLSTYERSDMDKGGIVKMTAFMCTDYKDLIFFTTLGDVAETLRDHDYTDLSKTAVLRAVLKEEADRMENEEEEKQNA